MSETLGLHDKRVDTNDDCDEALFQTWVDRIAFSKALSIGLNYAKILQRMPDWSNMDDETSELERLHRLLPTGLRLCVLPGAKHAVAVSKQLHLAEFTHAIPLVENFVYMCPYAIRVDTGLLITIEYVFDTSQPLDINTSSVRCSGWRCRYLIAAPTSRIDSRQELVGYDEGGRRVRERMLEPNNNCPDVAVVRVSNEQHHRLWYLISKQTMQTISGAIRTFSALKFTVSDLYAMAESICRAVHMRLRESVEPCALRRLMPHDIKLRCVASNVYHDAASVYEVSRFLALNTNDAFSTNTTKSKKRRRLLHPTSLSSSSPSSPSLLEETTLCKTPKSEGFKQQHQAATSKTTTVDASRCAIRRVLGHDLTEDALSTFEEVHVRIFVNLCFHSRHAQTLREAFHNGLDVWKFLLLMEAVAWPVNIAFEALALHACCAHMAAMDFL